PARPTASPAARRAVGLAGILAALFFITVAAVVGFYAGIRYKSGDEALKTNVVVERPPAPAATPEGETFESRKTAVDRDPMRESMRLSDELTAQPDKANDPEFLYLYGRSLMRSDKPDLAAAQFTSAVKKIQERPTSDKMSLMIDSYTAAIAARVGSNELAEADRISQEFRQLVGGPTTQPTAAGATATPGVSPAPE
ncbi:MAG TPA: hypothetical protein VER32_04085, partial [Pyrinomonadaceae bacterium]|nr:hypothetical protein [Pyrinomonadaceae bacterium]